MRPLRLMLDGFGSYRERTEVDFSGVDFFVLTGPTGAGKSTVIDALCFALYGTVPRWGKGNVIRNALAPSAAACRVCLVFEARGERYAAARLLTRDARGQVHTKAARLDRLDATVPLDADLDKLLEASVQQIAEGPDQVAGEVAELLGIGYEHFTQCVLLPQGRFAEFLHATPGDRQKLLIQLLAYGVYEQVGQKARERAKLAAQWLAIAEQRLTELGQITDADVDAARRRVAELDALVPQVDAAVEEIAALRTRWAEANRQAVQARQHLADLAALRMPDGVAELAGRLAAADELERRRVAERDLAEEAEAAAERACNGLAERQALQRWHDAHGRDAQLRAELAGLERRRDLADAAEAGLVAEQAAAERSVAAAEAALAAAEQAHRAAALAADLRTGEPCPVCLRPVTTMPRHHVAADLDQARAALTAARSTVAGLRTRLAAAGKDAAGARSAVTAMQRQLTEVAAALAGAPPLAGVEAALAARAAADAALGTARDRARAARAAADAAQRDRASLRTAEQQAWTALRAGRDGFVALGAPVVDGADLAAAWRTLLAWATGRRAELTAEAAELDRAEDELRAGGTTAAAELASLLARHGIDAGADVARAPVLLAAQRERAGHDLARLGERRAKATALAAEVTRYQEQRQVADMLGGLLRSGGFERWLCAEALDSLVIEASETLLQLSGGQYELDRSDRNELVVVDHNDAGTRRPVHTLSGGETFQASLALALALSRQVVGLSAGRRSLDSMFLDEGFGTLDESTLDVVASTLERLAAETDCMVGVVTHVPALAERIPVQFAVSREGASSRLRRV